MVLMLERFFFFFEPKSWFDVDGVGRMHHGMDGPDCEGTRSVEGRGVHLVTVAHNASCFHFASCFISIASYWGSSPSVSSFNINRHLALANPRPAEQGHMTWLISARRQKKWWDAPFCFGFLDMT